MKKFNRMALRFIFVVAAGATVLVTSLAVVGLAQSYYMRRPLTGLAEAIAEGSSTLAGLTDVALSSPSSGEVLKYDGSKWVNGADQVAGGGGGSGALAAAHGLSGDSTDWPDLLVCFGVSNQARTFRLNYSDPSNVLYLSIQADYIVYTRPGGAYVSCGGNCGGAGTADGQGCRKAISSIISDGKAIYLD